MRGHGILEEPSAAPFCSGAHPLSENPDAVGAGERRWGVVQPVGHHTVNVDGEGSNPSAPANFSDTRFNLDSPTFGITFKIALFQLPQLVKDLCGTFLN
jgi:hypothetical protein